MSRIGESHLFRITRIPSVFGRTDFLNSSFTRERGQGRTCYVFFSLPWFPSRRFLISHRCLADFSLPTIGDRCTMSNRAFAGFSSLKDEIIFGTSFETETSGYASPLVVDCARVPELRL